MHGVRFPLVSLGLLLLGCDPENDEIEFRTVEPVCIEEAPDETAWTCGGVKPVACEDVASTLELYVQLGPDQCSDAQLLPVEANFGPGTHEIVIEDTANHEFACTATLEITDNDAPAVEIADIRLWPPNHKLHEISLDDCIVAVTECDPSWTARMLYVTSDEPEDDRGDGHTDPDIEPRDVDTVALRSERQGGGNGRVYTIGFSVEDSSGNVAEHLCHVTVAHDQSGAVAIDDGDAWTIDLSIAD